MLNKKALSPLVATVLLVVFALIIGTATMTWSRGYVKNIPDESGKDTASASIIISYSQIDNDLKDLQLKYILGRISLEQYLEEEDTAITNSKK